MSNAMTAQERCDAHRRKSPLLHVYGSIGDPPCTTCRRAISARNRRRRHKTKKP